MEGGDQLIAVVALKDGYAKITAGDIPIFLAADLTELQQLATTLSRITKAMVHELPTGVYVLVRH